MAVKFIFFNFNITKTSLPIFIYESKFFIFYSDPLFAAKSAFSINPNKAGLFEGSFFWGRGQFDTTPPPLPLHISRRMYIVSI